MDEVAAMEDVQSDKRALREEMRRLRAFVTPAAARLAGESAATLLESHVAAFARSTGIALLYAPLPGELDSAPIDAMLRARGFAIAYPRVDGDRLRLHLGRPADLVPGRFAICEPPQHLPVVPASSVDLALVPALAFDRRGHRLGFGRGFYDRLLDEAPDATRCGACLPFQILSRVPDEPHDVAVDLVVVGGSPVEGGALLETHARALVAGRAVPSKENH